MHESSCFRSFKNALSFSQAQSACQAEGANLVSILDIETNKFVIDLVGGGYFWIGGHQPAGSSDWKWVGKGQWAFTKWYPGEPNDINGKEDCIAMGKK